MSKLQHDYSYCILELCQLVCLFVVVGYSIVCPIEQLSIASKKQHKSYGNQPFLQDLCLST